MTFVQKVSFSKAVNCFGILRKYVTVVAVTASAHQNVWPMCESTPECVSLKGGMRVGSLFI